MQLNKVNLLAWTTAFVLPTSFATKATEVAACAITANPKSFDHQNVTLQGMPSALRETTSRAGNDYTTFNLQNGDCEVKVFLWGHLTLANGDHVRLEGIFETEHHQGRYTFYNEVEATKVTPLPQ